VEAFPKRHRHSVSFPTQGTRVTVVTRDVWWNGLLMKGKKSQVSLKNIFNLCFKDEQNSYGFGTT